MVMSPELNLQSGKNGKPYIEELSRLPNWIREKSKEIAGLFWSRLYPTKAQDRLNIFDLQQKEGKPFVDFIYKFLQIYWN